MGERGDAIRLEEQVRCASQGQLVPGDPQAWKVVDNKLYLNYNKDVQQYWLQDVHGLVRKADED